MTNQIKCPKCGSTNWRCWDERHLEWWNKAGEPAATQVIGCLACNDCQWAWADVSSSDEELLAAGLFCDEEEQDTIYRAGWR